MPAQLRSTLLATFNSGFKLEDTGGGFFSQGHLYAPLRDGQATLIGYSDGTVDVRAWTGGPDPGPGIVFARQNLPLIVENGRLNPALSNDSLWGATLGNAVRVWRSGIGVDAHGNLIYAAADIQTAQSLARILQRAGAVRAMQLDINYEWTTFNFYGTFGAGDPTKLLPGMTVPRPGTCPPMTVTSSRSMRGRAGSPLHAKPAPCNSPGATSLAADVEIDVRGHGPRLLG